MISIRKRYYFQADPADYKGIGRPSKYGEEIHLMEVFDHFHLFQTVRARVYGQVEQISLLCLDLLWLPTGGWIRFVFAITSRRPIVLMCSNL